MAEEHFERVAHGPPSSGSGGGAAQAPLPEGRPVAALEAARQARRGILITGSPEATRAWAEAFTAGLGDEVLWVGGREGGAVAPRALRQHLGRSLAVVVLDAHAGLDPDALAACHGFVRAGGALLLRGADGLAPPDPRLAAWPHSVGEVGRRFEARARAVWGEHLEVVAANGPLPEALSAPPLVTRGTEEQAALVAALQAASSGGATVVMADRGRGKSAALGLAGQAMRGRRVAVTAASAESVAEVLRFAPALPFIPFEAAAEGELDVLFIDEAATSPVPALRRLTEARPHTHLVFTTTVHGYEGTGRGFALRFVPWLEARRPTARYTLRAPIRWAQRCPLERAVFGVLVLDAELAPLDAQSVGEPTFGCVDRDALAGGSAEGERDLRDLFGLLVQAHYRTTPSDLVRLLDAPNVAVYVARVGPERRIGAACLVAREGGFTAELTARVAGGERVQAHALADALVSHLGIAEAGPMRMARSVRIATHPALRRLGLARALAEYVHASEPAELFGTLFGAAPELLTFRRALGYRLVRVSASRNQRTGEPSVMMVRPVSARAEAMVKSLERALARELATQCALLRADGGLDEALEAALWAEVPAVAPYTWEEAEACVRAYAAGPRTFESVAEAVRRFVAEVDLSWLLAAERRVVEVRALALRPWEEAARAAGLAHAGLAMKAMRRALRALVGGARGPRRGAEGAS